jgi:hypothetical protein
MIDTNDVGRALRRLESHAPAEVEVLAGLRKGIVARRRRRQVASVVGVAGAAALVAVGVMVALPGHAGSPGTVDPATAAPPASEKVANPPPPAPALPFTVGWVPDGYTLRTWEAGGTDASAEFTGTKDFQDVVVWISAKPRDEIPGASRQDTTIAGRPGILQRFDPGKAEAQFVWQLADGRWAMVGGRTPTVTVEMLRKVAESVTLTPTPMTAPVQLSAMPDGYTSAVWSAGSVQLCRTATAARTDAPAADCITVSGNEGTAPKTYMVKTGTGTLKGNVRELPYGSPVTVGGVLTQSSADGTLVEAQVDATHWVSVSSQGAGVDLLRRVAATATVR